MTAVRLAGITKRFGQTAALDGIDLEIKAGELFFLLGPSGCGKSTLLRIIAGLETPSAGRLFFNGRDVTELPTEKRNAVMCFQSYALWPHMSVAENVRFGLAVRDMDRREQGRRVDEVLKLVQLDALASRKPNQLSGGQQQRVALARALAVNPDCLLLDEPLSNLDAQLRQEMRSEIRRICKAGGFTTIYVTHDQKEALSVADRIAVMNVGRLAQVGTPDELYRRPTSAFVAGFLGQTNLIRGKVIERNGETVKVQTAVGVLIARGLTSAEEVMLSIRPEQIRIDPNGSGIRASVVESTFLGESSEHVLEVSGLRLRVVCAPPKVGLHGEVSIHFDPENVVALDQ